MPELPEVETLRLQLEDKILNRKIKNVILKDKRIIKSNVEEFISFLKGKRVSKILRRGKVLIIGLEGLKYLIIHLRISGWLLYDKEEDKFSRVIIVFDDDKTLQFCDQRVLGEISLVDKWQDLPLIKSMGKDALEVTCEEFIQIFSHKNKKIKPLLMDQKYLAGVGNVYAQESLFCAGIHPNRLAKDIKEEEFKRLYKCLRDILKEAIKQKGSSVDTYRQIDGREGLYVPFLKVYQREKEPCLKCKSPIKRLVIEGRGTYFCERCQE